MSKFCQRCGNELPDDAQFCTKCGYNFSDNNNMVYTVPQGSSPLPVKKKGGCLKGLLIILGVLIGFIIIIMIAFGGDDKDKSKNNSSKTTTTKQNRDSVETTSPLSDEPKDEEKSVANKPTPKSGFNEETNIEVKNGGLIYHLPDYYKETDTQTEGYVLYKHTESNGSFGAIGFQLYDGEMIKNGLTKESAKQIFENLKNNYHNDGVSLAPISTDKIIDRTVYETYFEYNDDNEYYRAYLGLIENKEAHGVNVFRCDIYIVDGIQEYDYLADMDNVFYSIEEDKDYVFEKTTDTKKDDSSKPDENSKSEIDDIEAIKKAVTNGDYSLVTPEFKETMDAYEAFMDEYYNFMDNYETSTDLDYLNQYTALLQKEQEWIQKINDMDVSKMSPADYAYYLLITSRITGKLLKY